MSDPKIVVLSYVPPIPPWLDVGPWPLKPEDGTTKVHMWNIGAEHEKKARLKAITAQTERVFAAEKDRHPHHPLRVHRAVMAAREERTFYRCVFLSDQDLALVYIALGTPAHFREVVRRLNGMLARRQTRRALRSLVSRGLIRSERRDVGRHRGVRMYEKAL